MLRILYYTTTDGDYNSIFQALSSLEKSHPGAIAVDFFGKNSKRKTEDMISHLDEVDFVLVTLMGTFIGFDQFDVFIARAKEKGIPVHIQSSVMRNSAELRKKSGQEEDMSQKIEAYIYHGGSENYRELFLYLSNHLKGTGYPLEGIKEVPFEGIYYKKELYSSLDAFYVQRTKQELQIVVLFYRSQYLSENLRVVDALVQEGEERGVGILPFFFYSAASSDIKNKSFLEAFKQFFVTEEGPQVDAIINLAGFSINTGSGQIQDESRLDLKEIDLPIIKAFSSVGEFEAWKENPQGLTQIDYSMNLVMPEFDGQIMGQLVSHKEKNNYALQDVPYHQPYMPGIKDVLDMAIRYAKLRKKANQDKRLAIILHNYPAGDANIGSASGLDTFASVHLLLEKLKEQGYHLERSYASGEELLQDVLAHGTNERTWVDREEKRGSSLFLKEQEYRDVFDRFTPKEKEKIIKEWGEPPGKILLDEEGILIPGFSNGNIFIGMQPARGFGDDVSKITHSPDLVPHHQYIAYYSYLKHVWKADAYLHVGTHGTLEFLPGKSTGLSPECYPRQLLSCVPNFYYYIIKNPGEGTIAKRRTNASIISYLIPRLSFVRDYDELEELESIISQYERAEYEAMESSQVYWQELLQKVEQLKLHEDLDLSMEEERELILASLWKYLYEIKGNYITKGLHVLGEVPRGEQRIEMILVLMRLPNGEVPSLIASFSQAKGIDYQMLLDHPEEHSLHPTKRNGELLENLQEELRHLLGTWDQHNWREEEIKRTLEDEGLHHPDFSRAIDYLRGQLLPHLEACKEEMNSFFEGLQGKFILPGKSGNISRGGADLLPTGRNFYTLDPLTVPSRSAWKTGRELGDQVLRSYFESHGSYPESVAIVLWGLSTIRSRGDDLAEIYYLLGLEPLWDKGTQRIKDFKVIPREELGRPRIDVTVRISGVFRDIFPHQIELLEKAFALVAELKEEENYLRKHLEEDIEEALAQGKSEQEAREEALYRVFGSKPGAYGTGVSHAIDESAWESQEDLAELFLDWGGYVYTKEKQGVFLRKSFEKRLSRVEATIQNATSRETDILNVDDYYQYHGGLANAVRHLRGEKPEMYCGDSSDPHHVKLKTADKELKYVYRSRVLNSDWIQSMMEHGYKGAGDFSKMFKYTLGWDATADIMDDWMYEALAEKYILDEAMREFFHENNPMALQSMIETLLEANARQMWHAPEEMLASLYELLLETEGHLEEKIHFYGG